jgi:hypothetical protein
MPHGPDHLRARLRDRTGFGSSTSRAGFGLINLAIIVAVTTGTCAAQTPPVVGKCGGADGAAPEVRIAACSEVIESRAYTGKDLAFAYNNRGVAHYQHRDFDAAITDFGESIRLDPKVPRTSKIEHSLTRQRTTTFML